MIDRHDVAARSLRLVLARISNGDWQALDMTIAEFDEHPEQIPAAIQFLAGFAAGVLVATRGEEAAAAIVADLIAQQFDQEGTTP